MNPKLYAALSTCSPSLCWVKCVTKEQFLHISAILRMADVSEVDVIFEQACVPCGPARPPQPPSGTETAPAPRTNGSPSDDTEATPPPAPSDVPEQPARPIDYVPPHTENTRPPVAETPPPDQTGQTPPASPPAVLFPKGPSSPFGDTPTPPAPSDFKPFLPQVAPFSVPTVEKVKIRLDQTGLCDSALDAWRRADGAPALRRIFAMCRQLASNDPAQAADIDNILAKHPNTIPAYMAGPYATGGEGILTICSPRAELSALGYKLDFLPAMRALTVEARLLGKVVGHLLTDPIVGFRHAYALEATRLRFAARAITRMAMPYGLYSDNTFRHGYGYPGSACGGPAANAVDALRFRGEHLLANAIADACVHARLYLEDVSISPLLADLLGWLMPDLLPSSVRKCLAASNLNWLAAQDAAASGSNSLDPSSPLMVAIASSIRMRTSGGTTSIDEIMTLTAAAGAKDDGAMPSLRSLDDLFVDLMPAERGAASDFPRVVTARQALTHFSAPYDFVG